MPASLIIVINSHIWLDCSKIAGRTPLNGVRKFIDFNSVVVGSCR